MTKDLIAMLEETLRIAEQGSYRKDGETRLLKLSRQEQEESVLLPPEALRRMTEEDESRNAPWVIGRCRVSVRNEDSFEATGDIIESYDHDDTRSILVLNFANPIEPGGGVLRGARAQEEDLCRKSTLFRSLRTEKARAMYDYNRALHDYMASDYMILSPNVEILRDGSGELLDETRVVGVLTAAAPMLSLGYASASKDEVGEIMRMRIREMLHVAAAYGYEYLVLGAWGCGAFGNDADQVSKLFYEELKGFSRSRHTIKDYFKHIRFAVFDRSASQYNYKSFEKRFADFYADERNEAQHKGEQWKRDAEVYLDAIRGSLLGGAAGDALGYPVEFARRASIQKHYGSQGITSFDTWPDGLALISDDTQMTLFTATGILYGMTRGKMRGIMGPIESYVWASYSDWYRLQTGKKTERSNRVSWLVDIPEMGEDRAPGNTCLSALAGGKPGSPDKPVNNSHGCGGVMRIAPVALFFNRDPKGTDKIELVRRDAANIAALTHGHPLGWMPAAALAHIINRAAFHGQHVAEAVQEAIDYSREHEAVSVARDELLRIMERALALARSGKPDELNIPELGKGWVAEEALAIAIYCSVKYEDDFSRALCAAVNHDGDSDSTGAITGNILGSLWGYERIPEKWKRSLECRKVIMEVADDLCHGCQMSEYDEYRDPTWLEKYVDCRRQDASEHV